MTTLIVTFHGCTSFVVLYHYKNTPIQCTVIFQRCKNDYFQMKICDIFLIFAQNIHCGYTLEPSNEYPNLCFRAKIRK